MWQLLLGRMYYLGRGVLRDERDAFGWFIKAADQGSSDAAFALGVMYEKGQGRLQSYVKAVSWYQKAVDQQHAEAAYNLARLYRIGRGVALDLDRALNHYETAANAGLVSAQLSLAMLYEAGQGWQRDPVRAVRLVPPSCRERKYGMPKSIWPYLYAEGVGVPQDLIEAYALLDAADKGGHRLAKDNLDLVAARLSEAQIDAAEARAKRYIEFASPSLANLNNADEQVPK